MKAVGLFSGGLDSVLSAKLMKDLGFEVYSLYFRQPWQEKDPERIRKIAEGIEVNFHIIDLGQDYLDMLVSPRYGYGKAFNPCVDCHQFMVRKAGEFMQEIGASFVFTGEVVGQRPMSQRRQCLPLVEKGTGLEGYLLRPMSAKLLDETIPEQKGWVDRNKLLEISGRSRKEQLKLAKKWGVEGFLPTGGGCLITEIPFGARMKDFLSWPYRDPKETAVLKWGRYFRLNDDFIAIVGRSRQENELLMEHAHEDDHFVELADVSGPLLLLKGPQPNEYIFSLAGGMVQRYSKLRDSGPELIEYTKASDQGDSRTILAKKVSDEEIKSLER